MKKLSKIALFFSLFLVLFSFNACAESVAFNYPLGNETLNGTIILNATADYNCLNATFYYSNSSNPWQSFIGSNTTSGRNFTLLFDTNGITDGTYNFTINVTNSTLEKFSTTTNITINNPPKWVNNITSVQSGSQYSPGKAYQFNITWIDNNLSTILFESNYTLNGSASGSLYNYSNAFNSSGIFWVNLTDLPAQTFVYRWIANDTSGNLNSTGNLIYVITKNSSFYLNLTLNGTESNRSYNINEIANFTATLNFTNKTVYLDSNCLSWVNLTGNSSIALSISNTTNLTCSGLFFITAYWNGENYSDSSKTYYFDAISPQYSIIKPSGPSESYGFNQTYWFNITWSDATLKQVRFEFNNSSSSTNLFNKTFNLNSSGLYWINNITDYPAGDYKYKWCADDSLGNINCTNNTNFSISKPIVVPSLNINPNSIYASNSSTINCSKSGGDPSSLLTLRRNGTVVGTPGSAFTSYSNTFSEAGVYIFNCTIDASQNYSSYSSIDYLTVNSVPVIITPTPTTPPTSGSFTLTPSSSSITLGPNSSGTITLTLKNTYSYNFTKINITVSGIDASWYSLSKVSISVLQKNGTDTSILTLNIPGDAERKNYTLITSAVGRDPSGYRLTRQASIKLIIPELPQNVTNVTNVTNETESSNTTGIGSQTNQTNVTGLSIKLDEIRDYIVLIISSVAVILIFVFRNEFTDFIRGNKPKPEHKVHEESIVHAEPKKLHHIISHVKKKISSLSEHKLVIQIKKKEKKEEKT
jgi:hypothetical protein